MAVPKKRMSRARRDRRRAHWKRKLSLPGLVECPRCHEPKLNHRVCPNCGFYKNYQVLAQEN